MFDFKRSLRLLKTNLNPWPEGVKGLKLRSHREMVGGKWDEMGKLQFEFLRKQGLQTQNTLLDIGCGCFRAGRHFIHFLEPKHYAGIDKQTELIELGKTEELGKKILQLKKPFLRVNDSFDFEEIPFSPDFTLAQSLFTHLRTSDIRACLTNLRSICSPGSQFFCTFFVTNSAVIQAMLASHSSRKFEYTVTQIRDMGESCGWEFEYIGDWNHPRNQMMVRYWLQ